MTHGENMGGVMDEKRGKCDRSGYCRPNKGRTGTRRQTRLCFIGLSSISVGLGMTLAYITLDVKGVEEVHRFTRCAFL